MLSRPSNKWYLDTYGTLAMPSGQIEDLEEGKDFEVVSSQIKLDKNGEEKGLIIL